MAYPVTLNGRTYTLADFEGVNYVEGLPDAFEDFVTHAGDLYNDTSTTSNSIGTGSKTFTVSSGKPYQAGTPLRIADAAAPATNFLDAVVTSYSGTTLVVEAVGYGGSGTKTSWTVNIGGAKTIDGTLGVSQGGTGATTAAAARTNLDTYSKTEADSRFLNVSGEASNVTMTGDVTIGDAAGDTLTVNATADFNENVNVDGSITADGLTINAGTGSRQTNITGAGGLFRLQNYSGDGSVGNSDLYKIALTYDNANYNAGLHFTRGTGATDGHFYVSTSGQTKRFEIDNYGDISVYETDGSTKNIFIDVDNMTTFNNNASDIDFRVKSDGSSSMFFVDSATSRIGINYNSPATIMHIRGGDPDLTIETTNTSATTLGDKNSRIMLRGNSTTAGNGNEIVWATADDANRRWAVISGHIEGNTGSSASGGLVFGTKGTSESALNNRLHIKAGSEAVFNEDSTNYDFRVESDGNANALFVDATNSTVGINTNSAFQELTVNGNIAVGGAGNKGIYFGDNITSSADQEWLLANNASSSNSFILYEYDSGSYVSQRVEFLSGGNTRFDNGSGTQLVINDAGNNADFRVESDAVSDMFVVDGGTNCVNIGAIGSSSSTNYSLFVRGNNAESGKNTYYVQKIGASNYSDSGQYTALIGLGVEPNAAWAKGAIGWRRSSSYDRGDMVFLVNGSANNSTASNSDEKMRINSAGVVITGNLAKSSGSFKIDHPLPEKTETHELVHSFVEAPQADNIYRGKVDLVAGQATVNIDTVAGMTDGTFAALNREIQCFTSNETGWTAVRGSVSGNTLTIEAQDGTCTDTISWLVVGERQDQHMYDTEWTDENGKVIVEPLKDNPQP